MRFTVAAMAVAAGAFTAEGSAAVASVAAASAAAVLGGGGIRWIWGLSRRILGPAFNRTPSFSTPRTYLADEPQRVWQRQWSVQQRREYRTDVNNVNSFNRGNTFNKLTEVIRSITLIASTTLTNVNRMGAGWHNPYIGYHGGWNHGYWNGHYAGGWGWRPYGFGYPGFWGGGFGYGLGWGMGLGMGWGLSSWMFGPMLYNWGYSNYYNPYYSGLGYGGNTVVVQQPVVYDYSQPIDPQSCASRGNRRQPGGDHLRQRARSLQGGRLCQGTRPGGSGAQDDAQRHGTARVSCFVSLCAQAVRRGCRRAVLGTVGRPGLGLDDLDQPLRRPAIVHRATPSARELLQSESSIAPGGSCWAIIT